MLPERSDDGEAWNRYPLSLPLIRNEGLDLEFTKAVTIILGENGSGKSTNLEAIAKFAGFNDSGGGQGMRAVQHSVASGADGGALGDRLRGAWLPQVGRGWFFRAETFFSVARYLDEAAKEAGGIPSDYLSISHGEGFLEFFESRFDRQGLFILDEPESALSPQRQFDFLRQLRRMQDAANCQVIMATHSPILMALPDAALWAVDPFGFRPTTLEETPHFKIYREFSLYPQETVEAMIY